jgi:hypothetical protein
MIFLANIQKAQWVNKARPEVHFIMKVRAGCFACIAQVPDDIALRNPLAFFDRKTTQMPIASGKTVAVLNRD